jgi:hypothetical protein
MHERLMRAVEEGDVEVIDMWEEGDGHQDNTFVKRKVSKVLMELLSDGRMAGPGTVPISIVLYIDATYIKHGIPIRPIHSELLVSL